MLFKNSFYYKLGRASTKKREFFKLLLPLELPYIILSLLYIIFRFEMLQQINIIFLLVLLFSSSWFFIGPRLVYKFISLFLSFQTNEIICPKLRQYFKINEKVHFKLYKKYLIIEGTILSLVGVVPIILFPDILTKNITNGFTDIFFWLIIFFLVWFLFYCANATSFITLITFKIIRDVINDKTFVYNPINVAQHKSLEEIRHLCNKAVAYTCSGLVFIPLAIYFFLQQPELIFDLKKNSWKIISSPLNQPTYLIWVICLLLLYCAFLFLFITYPNYALKKYVRQKNKDYYFLEEIKYIKTIVDRPTLLSVITIQQNDLLSEQIYQYNVYLRLQEIKNLCLTSFAIDSNMIIAYITILVTLLSAVPGFVQLINQILL